MSEFEDRITRAGAPGEMRAVDIETIQVNIGLRCDLECLHCHVASSPRRSEEMTWETMEYVLRAVRLTRPGRVDITGGAPELNVNFRRLVTALRDEGVDVSVRTNLTVFFEPGQDDIGLFYRSRGVHLIASLPCYLEENVDGQRGDGVYWRSIKAIALLNNLGYGHDPGLVLDLVYNPTGPQLPGSQVELETAYRRELHERHGIRFTRLLTIANMPVGRFRADLKRRGHLDAYESQLREAFNPGTLEALMCRHQITVGWDGTLYDCDFNLALRRPLGDDLPVHIREYDPDRVQRRRVVTGDHCFGCTAGSGSSCGGALLTRETSESTVDCPAGL